MAGAAAGDPILSEDHARMGVSLRRAAAQTFNDVSATDVSWDTEDADTHGLWAIGTPTVITIPTGGGGMWNITAAIDLVATVANRSTLLIVVTSSITTWNGATNLRNSFFAGEDQCAVSGTIPLAAGDSFVVTVNADTASGTTGTARLSAYRVGL